MNLPMVMLYAFAGTFIGDFTFFTLGRRFGKNFIDKYEFVRNKVPLANKIIHKYGNPIIFIIRFLVGIRAVVLILLGCTNMKMSKFVLFNLVNSMAWSMLVSTIGYVFGKVVFVFVDDIKRYETIILPIVLVLVLVLILVYRHIVKRKEEEYGDE
jgi:membrane protein DedA with SNARE-associated domain